MFLWVCNHRFKAFGRFFDRFKKNKKKTESIHDFEHHTQIPRNKNILLEKYLEKSNLSKSNLRSKDSIRTELYRKDD